MAEVTIILPERERLSLNVYFWLRLISHDLGLGFCFHSFVYTSLVMTGGEAYLNNPSMGDVPITVGKTLVRFYDWPIAARMLQPTTVQSVSTRFEPLIADISIDPKGV